MRSSSRVVFALVTATAVLVLLGFLLEPRIFPARPPSRHQDHSINLSDREPAPTPSRPQNAAITSRPYDSSSGSDNYLDVIVMDAQTEALLDGATVHGDHGRTAQCGEQGRARFENGATRVVVSHPHYLTSPVIQAPDSPDVPLTVKLVRGATVSMRVRHYASELPVAHLGLRLRPLTGPVARPTGYPEPKVNEANENAIGSHIEWAPTGPNVLETRRGKTSESGLWTVEGLQPGSYLVSMERPDVCFVGDQVRVAVVEAPGEVLLETSPIYIRVVDIQCPAGCGARPHPKLSYVEPQWLQAMTSYGHPWTYEFAREALNRMAPLGSTTVARHVDVYCESEKPPLSSAGIRSEISVEGTSISANIVPIDRFHPSDVAVVRWVHQCGVAGRIRVHKHLHLDLPPLVIGEADESHFSSRSDGADWVFDVPYGRYLVSLPSGHSTVPVTVSEPEVSMAYPDLGELSVVKLIGSTAQGFASNAWMASITSREFDLGLDGVGSAAGTLLPDGDYHLSVYDLRGRTVSTKPFTVNRQSFSRVILPFVVDG